MTRNALWRADHSLVLASRSAGRLSMLSAAGIPVEPLPAEVDERRLEEEARAAGATTPEVAAMLAREKALAVSRRRPGRLVLGADQTLALGDDALHKPRDRDDAARQLAVMAGRSHQLISAAALARDGVVTFEARSVATLTMRHLSSEAIAAYLDAAGSSALETVGGYQIEGLGIQLFAAIDGDHFTIMGLPLLALLDRLRAEGYLVS